MASTYSPNLKLELIGNGDQSGTWGTTTNNNLGTLLEQAIAGITTVSVAAGDQILTNLNGVSDQARNAIINVTGTTSVDRTIFVPNGQTKTYIILNNTAGGYNVKVQTLASGGSGGVGEPAIIPFGASILIYCTGANCYTVAPYTAYTAVPVVLYGYASGTTLTVTTTSSSPVATPAPSGLIVPGQTIYNPGIFWDGAVTTGFPSGTTILPYRTNGTTGTGGAGTYAISAPSLVGASTYPQPIVALNTLTQIATVDYVQSKMQSPYFQGSPSADTATAAAFEGQISKTNSTSGVMIASQYYVPGNPLLLGQYVNGQATPDGAYISAWGTGTAGNATFTGYISAGAGLSTPGTTLTVTSGSVTGAISTSQYLVSRANPVIIGTKINGTTGALSWGVDKSQLVGSPTNPATFVAYGPLLNATAAFNASIATDYTAGGWVTLQNDAYYPDTTTPIGMNDVVRTPMLSYLSPLQLANVLWASNLASVVGSLGTQDDTNVAIYGGTIQNTTLSNVTLNNAAPIGTIAKTVGASSSGGLVSVNPGAAGSTLQSTAGASVNAGSFVVDSQYTITSLGNTTFTSIGATSGTFTGIINNLVTPTPGAGTTLTVTAGSGVAVGQFLTGAGISAGTKILSQLTATTWQVNTSQLVGSTTITRTDPVFIATGVGTGTGTATLNQWGLATGPYVQQGTGLRQSSNIVKIGWAGTDLVATVDVTDVGSLLGVGGYGQTWQDVTASRAFNTTYTNSTSRPIMVAANTASYTFTSLYAYINGVATLFSAGCWNAGANGSQSSISLIVPSGATYRLDFGSAGSAGGASRIWSELR